MSRCTAISAVAVRDALASTGGFIKPAAKLLGIARNTLYRRMGQLGLCAAAKTMREATGWRIGTSRRFDPVVKLAALEASDQTAMTSIERKRLYWRTWYWRHRVAQRKVA